jgi:D-aspartate ligase
VTPCISMNRTCNVLLIDGESAFSLRVLRCLADVATVRVHVLSSDRWAPIRFSRHRRRFIHHTAINFDEMRAEAICDAARATRADLLLPASLEAIHHASRYQHILRQTAALPPLPTPEQIDLASNKLSLASVMHSYHIPHPRIARLDDGNMVEKLACLTFPVLIKPHSSEGGRGIQICSDVQDALDVISGLPRANDFFAQEFISGEDIDCSFLAQDGKVLAHTIQRTILPSPKSFAPPDGVEFEEDPQILSHIERLAQSLQWSGVAHVDLIRDKHSKQTYVLDFNARYWRSLLASHAAGVNFPHLACLTAMGIPFKRPYAQRIRFIKPDAARRVLSKKFRKHKSLVSIVRETGIRFIARDPIPEIRTLSAGLGTLTMGMRKHMRNRKQQQKPAQDSGANHTVGPLSSSLAPQTELKAQAGTLPQIQPIRTSPPPRFGV